MLVLRQINIIFKILLFIKDISLSYLKECLLYQTT